MLIEGTCTFGGGFLRRSCGGKAIGQCVYCGAPFCGLHGELGPEYHEVCARSACQTKYSDVRGHRNWIAAHSGPNTVSMCAEDDCTERMQHLCQRCNLLFCEEHLKAGTVIEQRYDLPRKVVMLMCAHCSARRKIWD